MRAELIYCVVMNAKGLVGRSCCALMLMIPQVGFTQYGKHVLTSLDEVETLDCSRFYYDWPEYDPNETDIQLQNDVTLNPPDGYERIKIKPSSFAHWMRCLPLKKPGTRFTFWNGETKLYGKRRVKGKTVTYLKKERTQNSKRRIINFPVTQNMQCAEFATFNRFWYLNWFNDQIENSEQVEDAPKEDVRMMTSDGVELSWNRFQNEGKYFESVPIKTRSGKKLKIYRLKEKDEPVKMIEDGAGLVLPPADSTQFLNSLYSWTNTRSLYLSGMPVYRAEIQPGDLLIYPNPGRGKGLGHLIMVLDVAKKITRNDQGEIISEQTKVLLGQGNTPANSYHVMVGLKASDSNWYDWDSTQFQAKDKYGKIIKGFFSIPEIEDRHLYALKRFPMPLELHRQLLSGHGFVNKP